MYDDLFDFTVGFLFGFVGTGFLVTFTLGLAHLVKYSGVM